MSPAARRPRDVRGVEEAERRDRQLRQRLSAQILTATTQRLHAAAQVLVGADPAAPRPEPEALDAGQVLDALTRHLAQRPDPAATWLVLTALGGAFPEPEEVQAAVRAARAADVPDLLEHLLRAGARIARERGTPELEMDLVLDRVVVDVDFCATSDLHTGIQRVVRETLPRWDRDHEVHLVGWTSTSGAFRGLDAHEVHRVLRWGTPPPPQPVAQGAGAPQRRIVVPWRSTVVLPENPEAHRCAVLAALAQSSGNLLRAIGYDCIPVVSPELIHPGLPERFVRYLAALKHADLVAGISVSATAEFEGFSRMVQGQGLPGPTVVECSLPVESPASAPPRPRSQRPVVMSVGSFEPRKNQLAVLHAAERLWREGLDFELDFVGGGGYRTEFDALRQRLVEESGRRIRVRVAIPEEELWATYRSARFSVFTSLHEGFGLPVAESLSVGTPALTTSYGSTAEIARDGGVVTVDPRDDEAMVAAMRELLTDDDLVERLRQDAVARTPRTWDDYARELWPLLAGDGAGRRQREGAR